MCWCQLVIDGPCLHSPPCPLQPWPFLCLPSVLHWIGLLWPPWLPYIHLAWCWVWVSGSFSWVSGWFLPWAPLPSWGKSDTCIHHGCNVCFPGGYLGSTVKFGPLAKMAFCTGVRVVDRLMTHLLLVGGVAGTGTVEVEVVDVGTTVFVCANTVRVSTKSAETVVKKVYTGFS